MADLGITFATFHKLQYLAEMEREVARLRHQNNELLRREHERQRQEYERQQAYWAAPVHNPYTPVQRPLTGYQQTGTVTGRMNGKQQALQELRRGPLRFEEGLAEPEDPYAIYRNMWYEQDVTFAPDSKVEDAPTLPNRKALELFRSRLNEWQRQTFDEHGCIDVRGGRSGHWWRIDTTGSTSKNVLDMATMTRYCFHLRDYALPRFDHFTAQAVLIALDDSKISRYPSQAEETIRYRRKIDSLYPVKENA